MSKNKYVSTALTQARALARRYTRNESGNFAVISAFAAVPLLLATTAAIDAANMIRVRTDLQAAVDDAALAAVIPANMNNTEREEFAEKTFFDNVGTNVKFSLTTESTATRQRVDLSAKGTVPSLLGGMIGHGSNTLSVHSAAELTTSDVVCVLALDPDSENTISFEDNAVFNAPACSVVANSTASDAILSSSNTPPHAKSFCSAGGSRGKFDPFIKNECTPIEDPYAELVIPKAGTSCDDVGQVTNRGWGGRWYKESELPKTATGDSYIPDDSTMRPGIYCRGLIIDGRSVELEPGIYHVWGDLHFTNNSEVVGDGVTFIIKGTSNRLLIDNGAQVTLKAPATGQTAGLVFWQKYLEFYPYIFGRIPDSPDRVIATSEIASGGGLNLIGTAYLPDHKLNISSENRVASQSPAMSFIARQVQFTQNANMVVRVDHEMGGIPPIQPRSDDAARLVQ